MDDTTRRAFLTILAGIVPASALKTLGIENDFDADGIEAWEDCDNYYEYNKEPDWCGLQRGDLKLFENSFMELGYNDLSKEVAIIRVESPPENWHDPKLSDFKKIGMPQTMKLTRVDHKDGSISYHADEVVWLQNPADTSMAAGAILYSRATSPCTPIAYNHFGYVSRECGDITLAWNKDGIFTIALS